MSRFRTDDPSQAQAKLQEGQLREWIRLGREEDFLALVKDTTFHSIALTPAVLRALAVEQRDAWWPAIAERVDPGVIAKAAEDSLTWEGHPALAEVYLDRVRPQDQRAGAWRRAIFKGQVDRLDRLEQLWGLGDFSPALFTQSLATKRLDITLWLAHRLGDRVWTEQAVLAMASRPDAPDELKLAAVASAQTETTWRTAFKQDARIHHDRWLDLQESRQDCSAWFEDAVDAALSQGHWDVAQRYLGRVRLDDLRTRLVQRIERQTGSFTWSQMDAWCATLPESVQRYMVQGLELHLPRTQALARGAQGQTLDLNSARTGARPRA